MFDIFEAMFGESFKKEAEEIIAPYKNSKNNVEINRKSFKSGERPKKDKIAQLLKDYSETEFGPEGLLKRYSKDYHMRRKNGQKVDL